MRSRILSSSVTLIVAVFVVVSSEHLFSQTAGMSQPAASSDADLIKSAMAAAPAAVSEHATIINLDAQMQIRTLREGTNGWTCLPDAPTTPGVDPMCLDRNAFQWMQAYMAKQDPPKDMIGFGYMLMGGSDASNDDPFAAGPAEGQRWIDTGPHVMIFNVADRITGYPTSATDPRAPYVMWANTPYAHVMMPVK
jgi:hypothetical protein